MVRSVAHPLSEMFTLAAADDLDGVTTSLDISGASQVIIAQWNVGTLGTAGVDMIEFSIDGSEWLAATAANLALAAPGHLGLLTEDGSKAATSGAALNAAGVEPTGVALFSLAGIPGPCKIRCGRKTTDTGGTTWVTGAPAVTAIVVGGAPAQA